MYEQYYNCRHSSGMRSGTVPHTLVVGLGAACEIAGEEMEVLWQLLFGPQHNQKTACSLCELLSYSFSHFINSTSN